MKIMRQIVDILFYWARACLAMLAMVVVGQEVCKLANFSRGQIINIAKDQVLDHEIIGDELAGVD